MSDRTYSEESVEEAYRLGYRVGFRDASRADAGVLRLIGTGKIREPMPSTEDALDVVLLCAEVIQECGAGYTDEDLESRALADEVAK